MTLHCGPTRNVRYPECAGELICWLVILFCGFWRPFKPALGSVCRSKLTSEVKVTMSIYFSAGPCPGVFLGPRARLAAGAGAEVLSGALMSTPCGSPVPLV